MQTITMNTDGGARGNPGPAGVGIIFYDAEGNSIGEFAEFIGETTNNVAEYTAIVRGLEHLATIVPDTKGVKLTVRLDSELVQRQMIGQYKVKDANLKTYFEKAKTLVEEYAEVLFVHVPRSENKVADRLANEAMDRSV